jgi:hypothetical protein
MLIQDSPHTYENASAEFGCAVAHAAERLLLLDAGAGVNDALQEIADGYGDAVKHFQDQPRHFYASRGTDVCLIEQPT